MLLGFLEVSLLSLSLRPYCLSGVLLHACVCESRRDKCASGLVMEASIFPKFSQFHHSGNDQIIGAPCEGLHPARMSDSTIMKKRKSLKHVVNSIMQVQEIDDFSHGNYIC